MQDSIQLHLRGKPMTLESTHTVLVIGHRHPDTDAVCSALAYVSFYCCLSFRFIAAWHIQPAGRFGAEQAR
jgi:hypothetical protein